MNCLPLIVSKASVEPALADPDAEPPQYLPLHSSDTHELKTVDIDVRFRNLSSIYNQNCPINPKALSPKAHF